MIRPAVLALAVFLLAVQGRPIDARFAKPVVESISRVYAKQTQTIVIVGEISATTRRTMVTLPIYGWSIYKLAVGTGALDARNNMALALPR
jgi:hypothetical protein